MNGGLPNEWERDLQDAGLLDGGAQVDRRELIRRLVALGVAPAMAASVLASSARAAETRTSSAAATQATVPGFKWKGGSKGGTARVGWHDTSVIYDPPTTFGEGAYYGLPLFYRGLLYLGGSLDNPQAQLDIAESMDINSAATRYRFKLKQGVQFHHGREVVASDFKYSLERGATIKGNWAGGYLASIKGYDALVSGRAKQLSGVKAPDKYTLELELTAPDVTITKALAIPPHFAYPSEEVERHGEDWVHNPVGSGPYRLESYDSVAAKLEASRFDKYLYNELPYIDSLDWQWNTSPQLQFLRVQRGDLDGMGSKLPAGAVATLRKSTKYAAQFKEWNSYYLRFFQLNVTRKPFNDVRVRQAVNYAINGSRWRAIQLNPTRHLFPPGLLGYDKNLRTYDYDPERARALLKQAGYDNDLKFVLPILAAGDAGAGQYEQLLQQDLKQIGVNVTLKRVAANSGELGAKKLQSTYALWLTNWGMGLPDPAELYVSLVGSKAPFNLGGYSNAKVDRLGRLGQRQTDLAKRAAIYRQLEKILVNDAGVLFLGVDQTSTFHGPQVQNFLWEPVLWQHWDRYWLKG